MCHDAREGARSAIERSSGSLVNDTLMCIYGRLSLADLLVCRRTDTRWLALVDATIRSADWLSAQLSGCHFRREFPFSVRHGDANPAGENTSATVECGCSRDGNVRILVEESEVTSDASDVSDEEDGLYVADAKAGLWRARYEGRLAWMDVERARSALRLHVGKPPSWTRELIKADEASPHGLHHVHVDVATERAVTEAPAGSSLRAPRALPIALCITVTRSERRGDYAVGACAKVATPPTRLSGYLRCSGRDLRLALQLPFAAGGYNRGVSGLRWVTLPGVCVVSPV